MPTVADLAKRLQARARKRKLKRKLKRQPTQKPIRFLPPALLLMSDEKRLPDPLAQLARLPGGTGVVLRHYEAAGRALMARALVAGARARRTPVLIAGDWRLALLAHADGLHLPEAMIGRPLVLGPKSLCRKLFVTISAHSPRAVFRAARRGADAAIVGPVFKTASHPGAPFLGPWRFARLCRQSPIPVYAIGGITLKTARRLAGSGAAGLAGIGWVRPPGRAA